MAIVVLVALLAAFGIAALINSHPWTADPVAPRLSVAPGLEVALGDSVAVSHGGQLAVAPAAPAAGGKARFAAQSDGEGEGDGAPRLGIAPARVAQVPATLAAPEAAREPRAPEAPAPESVPAPEVVPVAAPAPPPAAESAPAPSGPIGGAEGGPQGPIAGGIEVEGALTDVQVCDGDEYTLSFTRGEAGAIGEPVPVPSAGSAPHTAIVYFGSSSEGDRFYLAFLDGRLIGIGESFRPIDPGRECALIDSGLLDLGEGVEGTYEIRFEGTDLGEPGESALP